MRQGIPERFREDAVELGGFSGYRMPGDGRAVAGNGFLMANQRVAPHNHWLCAKYDARNNVEVFSAISAAMYLYKYGYNGPGRSALEIGERRCQIVFGR